MRPTERNVRIAAALIIAAGFAATGLAILAAELGIGPEISRHRFGWKRASLLVAGVVALAVGALLVARPGIASRLIDWERIGDHVERSSGRYSGYLAIGLLGLLGIVLVWSRLLNISASLWHDEAVSAMTFTSLGAVLDNPAAHVLYNLLSAATTSLVGESEATLRFWSVVPGIAAIGIATWWAWRRVGAVAAVAFAALAVAAPLHLDVAPQARGYGLALLAATLMLIAADRLVRSYSRWTLLGFLAAGLVGIWTLIFFAFSFVGQALSLLKWPRLRRPVVVAVAVAGVLSLLVYAPVVTPFFAPGGDAPSGAWNQQIGGDTGITLGSALLLDHTINWLVVPTVALLGVEQRPGALINHPDTPGWAAIVVLALIAVAIVALWRRGESGLALILVLPPLAFNLGFSLGEFTTVARHQLVLLPHVLLLVAIGIAELGGIVARFRVLKPIAVAAGVIAVLALARATVEEEQARAIPRENFKEVAHVVRSADAPPVVTDSNLAQGLIYYLSDVLTVLSPQDMEAMLCEKRGEMTYIRHVPWPHYGVAPLDCLIGANAVRIRIAQRTRGGHIDVWIIEPRASRERLEVDRGEAPRPEPRRAERARASGADRGANRRR